MERGAHGAQPPGGRPRGLLSLAALVVATTLGLGVSVRLAHACAPLRWLRRCADCRNNRPRRAVSFAAEASGHAPAGERGPGCRHCGAGVRAELPATLWGTVPALSCLHLPRGAAAGAAREQVPPLLSAQRGASGASVLTHLVGLVGTEVAPPRTRMHSAHARYATRLCLSSCRPTCWFGGATSAAARRTRRGQGILRFRLGPHPCV